MRFERTTYRVGVCHSIQLSYGRIYNLYLTTTAQLDELRAHIYNLIII